MAPNPQSNESQDLRKPMAFPSESWETVYKIRQKVSEDMDESIRVGKRSMKPGSEIIFSDKMKDWLNRSAENLKETIFVLLAEITGYSKKTMTEEESKALDAVVEELLDDPTIYFHPDRFLALKSFFRKSTMGEWLSEDKNHEPKEEDLNRGALDLIELLSQRLGLVNR